MSTTSHALVRTARRLLPPLLVAGLVTVAVLLSIRTFGGHSPADLRRDLLGLGPGAVLAALVATAVSYLAMTGYDALALRHVDHPLPYRRYGLASFVATALGNNVGASVLVGAALRARVYSSWAVPGPVITRIVGVNLVTLALGFAVLAGAGTLLAPARVGTALHLPVAGTLALGALLLGSVVAYLLWAFTAGRTPARRGRRAQAPSPRVATAQVALSTVEWLAMAAALHVLLPAQDRLPFLPFAVAFAIATVVGLLSNVPGGLGVFETTLVLLIGATGSPTGLAVALLAYRLCYYVVPLVLAVVLLTGHELRRARGSSVLRSTARTSRVRVPGVLAAGAAVAGVLLLVQGEIPGTRPLGVSAVTVGLAGLSALFLARGLHRRLKSAWVGTLALLAGVCVIASAAGDLVLTAGAAVLGLVLVRVRPVFHRGSLRARPSDVLWSVTSAVLVGIAVWWQEFSRFSGAGEAPLLRACLLPGTPFLDRVAMAAGAVGVLVAGFRILRSAVRHPRTSDAAHLAQVGDIVARSGRCISQLAFTGDKLFHFSPGGRAFLMYQVQGRSWVVMGDPVGEAGEFGDLVASFVERVDRHAGRPVFYNVLADHADLYGEFGLSLAKLGEEAVVPLPEFSLAGKARTGLRNCRNKSRRLGMTVEFVAPDDVAPLLPELRHVSEAWLTHRNGREKRFSLGAFDEHYVRRFPLVVVRQEGRVIAFATLWVGGDGREVQVDLMRRLPDGPRTVMTFLFVECILWAQQAGYSSFNMGMAPLAGLRTGAGAPFWDRLGHLVWTHGERFYNFKGLREFKQGFGPRWQTCYVAAPDGTALPNAMVNVVTLVGGGLRGVVRG